MVVEAHHYDSQGAQGKEVAMGEVGGRTIRASGGRRRIYVAVVTCISRFRRALTQ